MAARAGVSVDTVRFYERKGLLRTPERTSSGYRTFPPSAVERIRITRELGRLGLTLDEIAAALRARADGGECAEELWRLETVRDRIDARIAELEATRANLAEVIEACRDGRCRIHAPD